MTELAASSGNRREDTFRQARRVLGTLGGVRSLGLLVFIAVVWLVFQVTTKGLFLTPRNLTVLTVQFSITAILACGIVMVMVAGHIDLSIGAVVAFSAIVAAVLLEDFNLPVPLAILATIGVGLAVGIWHGLWVSRSRVPSFIVTLASLMIFRGLGLWLTGGATRTPGADITFIASQFIPAGFASLIWAAAWVGFVALLVRERSAKEAAGIYSTVARDVLPQAVAFGLVSVGASVVAFSYRGMPVPVLIVMVVFATVWFVMRHTTFGRRVYAIGGNPEAARYAGVNIGSHSFRVFLAMGALYAVAGLVLVARLNTAPPNAAQGLELNVIAASVIGGTSLLGGIGTVGGAVIGALLMESLNNGMSLMNLPSFYQQIAVGLVLLVAVFVDIRARSTTA
jgi:ABC-type xylose transport system permease subunit